MRNWRVGMAALAVLGATFTSGSARAELTSSEKGQIRDFVAAAKAENAGKVRSLVARTDLGPAESAEALAEAVSPVAFTPERGIFLKELVFGGPSAASRATLTVTTLRALLSRADAIYAKYVGLDHEPKALAELVAIYAYIDTTLANAGKPTPAQHDAAAGIPMATYDECAKILKAHIDQQSRWLKGDGAVPEPAARVRAQAQIAFVDMLPDGLTRRVDAADRLGLKGARRAMLADDGVLFADAGKTDKVERVRQVLAHVPATRSELSLVYVGADRGAPLVARGTVIEAAASGEPWPFEGAAPAGFDAATSAVAHDVLVRAAKRAMDTRAELKAQVDRDAAASSGDAHRLVGRPRAPSTVHVLAAAMHALVTDAGKALEAAQARQKDGRPESAALVSDALGALADAPTAKVEVGKGGDAWVPVTGLKTAPNGVATAFSIEGAAWSIDRVSPAFAVTGMKRAGGPPVATNAKK